MQATQTNEAPAAVGPYSQGIITDNLIFTAGQLPSDPASGELCDNDIASAAKRALENLRAVLKAGGTDLSQVLKVTVYLRDMADFSGFNAVYAEFFSKPYPARTCIQAGALPRNARLEIEAIASRAK